MRVIRCPEVVELKSWEKPVFLAGGISNCPDWQASAIRYAKKVATHEHSRLVLINPRRKNFDINDPTMARKQIEWEYSALTKTPTVIFWFPKETLCPITLFELGKMSAKNKMLIVGCHKEYARKFDVQVQLELELGLGFCDTAALWPVHSSPKACINHVLKWVARDR